MDWKKILVELLKAVISILIGAGSATLCLTQM